MNDFVEFSQLKKNYDLSKYGLRNSVKIEKLINVGELEAIKQGDCMFISIESFEKYIYKLDKILTDYLTINDFLTDFLGDLYTRETNAYIDSVRKLVEDSCLELIELKIPIKAEKYFINKESYYKFKADYISIAAVYQNAQVYKTIEIFRTNLKKWNIKILIFISRYEFMFVKKEIMKLFEEIRNGIPYKDALIQLGVPKGRFYAVLKEHKINTWFASGTHTLLRKDLETLLSKQADTYKELVENYYTEEEILESYKKEIVTGDGVSLNILKKMTNRKIPAIAQIGKFKNIKGKLYIKTEIDIYLSKLKKEKEKNQLYDTTTSDYYGLYQQILQIENISFSQNASKTKELWFQFVKIKLRNKRWTYKSKTSRVNTFKQATRLLVDTTMDKELYEFTEKELNFAIFNNMVGVTLQGEVYSFLYNINQSFEQFGKKIFDLTKLNYKYTNRKIPTIKEIYTIDEYLSLHSYVCDFERHKKLAIEDIKVALTNIPKSKKYDSMWLFVLLHLNNGWRCSDVINFPRYPSHLFSIYDLTSINSLEKLQLTYDEAEKIVNYYKIQWYKHNKTNAKAEFYCSSFLTLPIAYAILFCEYRCRMLHLHDEKNLIHFKTKRNRIPTSTHDTFFKGFKYDFKFESRKMNRTVLSLTASVINKSINDPIEIARQLRGHRDKETSNIYVQIPQEHMNFISKQLFDTGYFGYVYDAVGNLLLGEPPAVRSDRTDRSLKIREILGDMVKLEDTATYLKSLSKEREELGKYLEKVSKEELHKKINLINMGLSPAREENYQCFFSDCIANTIDCNVCPFSIPHFFALSSICNRILRTLSKYKLALIDSNLPEGELSKLTRLFLSDYDKILGAINTFGIDIVEMFIEAEYQDFENMVNQLEQPQPTI